MGDSKLTLIEATALLKRAVELDSSRRFTEAILYYQEGIERLVEVMKGKKLIMFSSYLLIDH